MRTFNNEQEQVEFLKEWWENYGRLILVGLAVGILVMYGWRYYLSQHEKTSVQASALYEQILEAQTAGDNAAIPAQVELLKKNYRKTPYAALGVLMQARVMVEANELSAARAQLQWVIENSNDKRTQDIARIRMARLHLAAAEYPLALEKLDAQATTDFNIYADEVRGDVYFAMNDLPKARSTYETAKKAAGDQPAGNLIEMKLANLAE